MENLNIQENQSRTHYVVLSRRDLVRLWKKANAESIKIYGQKRLNSTIIVDLIETKGYNSKFDNAEQMNLS